ncbi:MULTISPECIES: hypothetical protein [unclassified Roseitalea]|uniref:lipoate--protein ligase family protein n=1 Tax=unclassified Roseitalea TaxID=2639107 RepID=UPI00273D7D30|nr:MULTISPECIES: hypothetical protein [unclassified Roseitalea]
MTGPIHSVTDPTSGLMLEAELLAGAGPGVVSWTSKTRAIVCPASMSRKKGFKAAADRSAARGWPVVSRPTGGGAVPQGPGVLNLAVALTVKPGFTIEDGYRLLTRPIMHTLAQADLLAEIGDTPGSFCDGKWNLSVAGRKIVGTAQRWRSLPQGGTRVLIHALILTHGRLGPGAIAVDALHQGLALGKRVRPEAHTSLEAVLEARPAEVSALGTSFHDAAWRELTRTAPGQEVRAAA